MKRTFPMDYEIYSLGHPLDQSPERFGSLRCSDDALGDFVELRERLREDGYLYLPGFHPREDVMNARFRILQQLADMANRELTVYDAEALRNTPAIRRDVAAKAVDIANTMSDYFSIPFDSNLLFEVDDAESNSVKHEKFNVQQLDLLSY